MICPLSHYHPLSSKPCSEARRVTHLPLVAGASDCASCVGVLLELARVIVANPSVRLESPVIILLNGAEETFLQACRATV